MKRMHPSPALVVSLLALFVALGGTSYAAINSLPANSVGTPQLKNGAVTAPKINASALLRPVVYAFVGPNGAIDVSQSSGITKSMVRKVSVAGGGAVFCFSGLPIKPRGGSVTPNGDLGTFTGGSNRFVILTISDSGQTRDCHAGESVEATEPPGQQSAPFPFRIVLYG
jgi:hypothetical protein